MPELWAILLVSYLICGISVVNKIISAPFIDRPAWAFHISLLKYLVATMVWFLFSSYKITISITNSCFLFAAVSLALWLSFYLLETFIDNPLLLWLIAIPLTYLIGFVIQVIGIILLLVTGLLFDSIKNFFYKRKNTKDPLQIAKEIIRNMTNKYLLPCEFEDICYQRIKKNYKRVFQEENISIDLLTTRFMESTASDMLLSGNFHIYRGVLSMQGESLLEIYNEIIDIKCQTGIIPETLAKEKKDFMRERLDRCY